jgi:hypothetical protein
MSTLKEKVAKAMEATRQHNRNIIIAAQQQQPSSDAAHEQAPQSSVIEPIAVNSQLQPPDPLPAQPAQHDAPLIDPPQVLVAIASSEAKENNEDDTSSRKKKNSKRKKFQAGVTCLCSDVRAEKEKRVKKHDELIASWTEESKLSIVVYQQQVELIIVRKKCKKCSILLYVVICDMYIFFLCTPKDFSVVVEFCLLCIAFSFSVFCYTNELLPAPDPSEYVCSVRIVMKCLCSVLDFMNAVLNHRPIDC